MNTVPPDEHLRQALRHAPDADLSAPRDISARILAAAHRSVAAPAPAAAAEPARWRRWLAWPRQSPGTSAALASVVLAGFVGLLWRGEAPGPALDEAPRRIAQAPAARPAPAMTSAAVPAAAPVTAGASPAAVRPAPASEKSAPTAAMPSTGAAPRRAAGNAGPQPAPVLRTQPAEIAPVQPDPPSAAEPLAKAESRSKPQAPPTPSLPEPAPAPAQTAAAPPAHAAVSAQAGRSQRLATAAAPAPEAATARRAAASALAAADAGPRPPWQAADMAAHAWRWQPESALRSPDRAWWEALARAAHGRWQVVADAQPVAGAMGLEARRDAEQVRRLWIEPASVLWCGETPPCQQAPLTADSRRELLEMLAR